MRQLVLENLLPNGMHRQYINLLRTFFDGKYFNLLIAWSRSDRRAFQGRGNIFIEGDHLPISILLRKLIPPLLKITLPISKVQQCRLRHKDFPTLALTRFDVAAFLGVQAIGRYAQAVHWSAEPIS